MLERENLLGELAVLLPPVMDERHFPAFTSFNLPPVSLYGH